MPRRIQRPSPVRLAKPDSLSERIFLDLRARLQRCEIRVEDRLVDLEVAAAYGVSRMPAREALLRLANEGYLVGTTRGFVTPRLSLDDIRDIFEVRKLLEPHAAASAARDLDDRGRQALTKAIVDARLAAKEDDVERLIMANISFRRGWLDALRNERLAITLARFVDHVQTVRLGTLRDQETRSVVAAGLEELYDAFMRRDIDAARARMTSFMEAAEQAFYKVRKSEIEHEEATAKAGARSA
jgi:DNA-binding GntR family transcriptional regulator